MEDVQELKFNDTQCCDTTGKAKIDLQHANRNPNSYIYARKQKKANRQTDRQTETNPDRGTNRVRNCPNNLGCTRT